MSFIYTAIKSLFYTSDELYHPAEIFDVSSDVIDASGQIKKQNTLHAVIMKMLTNIVVIVVEIKIIMIVIVI